MKKIGGYPNTNCLNNCIFKDETCTTLQTTSNLEFSGTNLKAVQNTPAGYTFNGCIQCTFTNDNIVVRYPITVQ